MGKLYVARHGETVWNLDNKVCGRTNVELTDKGRKQALALVDKLKDVPIDRIFVSPLKRARGTAEPVAASKHILPVVEERLIEQCYGEFEGKDKRTDEFYQAKRNFVCRYPGGESMFELAQRIYNLLDETKEKYGDQNVLFVCHGGVGRAINAYFNDITNEEYTTYTLHNGEVAEYEWK